jgi:hypothetical protein
VRKWFFSPVKTIYDRRRRFNDRRSISCSLLVKILVDGAVATFPGGLFFRMVVLTEEVGIPNNSGKAVLSASNSALMVGFHFWAVSGLELKKRLSLRSSKTGDRHALSAGVILVVSRMMSMIKSSWSNGLHGRQQDFDFQIWLHTSPYPSKKDSRRSKKYYYM